MLSTDKNICTSSKDTNGNYINSESKNSKNRKNDFKTLHFPCFAKNFKLSDKSKSSFKQISKLN